MEGVQTGCHLHRLHLVYGFACGIEGSTKMQRRTTVRVVVFYDEVLHFLSVDEWCCERMFLRFDVIVVLESIGSQQLLYFLMRTRCNLIDHRPRERNLRFVFQIVEEGSRYQSVGHPTFSIGKDTSFHFVAIVRAVVH